MLIFISQIRPFYSTYLPDSKTDGELTQTTENDDSFLSFFFFFLITSFFLETVFSTKILIKLWFMLRLNCLEI